MTDSRIGIGFIGCGDVALRSYVPGMAAVSDLATTVAVYDADPARAERLADDLAARGLSSASCGSRRSRHCSPTRT